MNRPTPQIREWFTLEHADGTFPPGVWVTAGRLGGEWGVFYGTLDKILNFIAEAHIAEAIADLKRQGAVTLARMVEGVTGDVAALSAGREKLACDLAGRRFR
jgi:hypothetical protein